jgi:hypothetical protein
MEFSIQSPAVPVIAKDNCPASLAANAASSAILYGRFRSIAAVGMLEMPVSLLILEADLLVVATDLLLGCCSFGGR